ncbi:hypothetical protein [Scytonema sp. NUACC26]|uniref:hypothetical protein n=1 Tax=Scytonema sp. NUACC26 TaxID=3140176 RepID=UPI0034DC00B6
MNTTSNSEIDSEVLRSQLAKDYRQLSTLEQSIIQLFSVVYEPINRTTFLDCFTYTGARNENGLLFNASNLKPYLDKLLASGLLVQPIGFGPQCHPLLVEIATRDAVKTGRFNVFVKTVQDKLPIKTQWQGGPRFFKSKSQLIREVRIGLYSHNLNFINEQLENYKKYNTRENISIEDIFEQVCNNPFDADWFRTLPEELYEKAISSILSSAALKCKPADDAFALLEEHCSSIDPSHDLQLLLTEQLLLRGHIQEAQQSLECILDEYQHHATVYWGWLSFSRGENDKAIEYYTAGLKAHKKGKSQRPIYFNTISGLFFILALLKDDSPERLREAEEYASLISCQPKHWLKLVYSRLEIVLQVQQGDVEQTILIVDAYIPSLINGNSLETLFCCLCLYWMDIEQAKKRLPKLLEHLYKHAMASGYDWVAMEAAELLSRLIPDSHYETKAEILLEDIEIESIVNLIQPQEPWEFSLKALANIQKEPQSPSKINLELRLAWFITFYSNKCLLQPREQKINAKGAWGVGRPIALKRLSNNLSEFNYITPQDLRLCAYIETYHDNSHGYYGKTEYSLNEKAILELVGHPFVFWENSPTTRVEIVKGEPELLVKKSDKPGTACAKGDAAKQPLRERNRLTLEFFPKLPEKQEILAIKETPTRIKAIEISAGHRRIAEILGKENRLEVPAIAKDRVLAAINAVSGIVTVHSDIGGGLENAKEVSAKPTPHVHLLPAGDGLKVAILVRPFDGGGPYYNPGTGGETVIAEVEGTRLQTTRNLSEEKQLANAVVAACPTLTRHEEREGEWLVNELENCLELLQELQALEDSIILEWPEGEKFRIGHRADFNDFQMKIQRQGDWFAVSGELKLDENIVFDMQQLVELLELLKTSKFTKYSRLVSPLNFTVLVSFLFNRYTFHVTPWRSPSDTSLLLCA